MFPLDDTSGRPSQTRSGCARLPPRYPVRASGWSGVPSRSSGRWHGGATSCTSTHLTPRSAGRRASPRTRSRASTCPSSGDCNSWWSRSPAAAVRYCSATPRRRKSARCTTPIAKPAPRGCGRCGYRPGEPSTATPRAADPSRSFSSRISEVIADSCQPSALSFQLSAFSSQPSAVSCQLSAISLRCYTFTQCVPAKVAELADAPDLGSGSRKAMGVQVPPFAPASSPMDPTPMKADLVDVNETRKNLKIEIPSDVVDRQIERVTRSYSQRARVPGFRPGKAPSRVIKLRFKEQILSDVAHELVPRAVDEALRERGVEPVDTPDVHDVSVEEGQALTFTASFDTLPSFDVGDYSTLALRPRSAHVEDEAVSQALERLRLRAARFEPVEDRAIVDTDFVVVDLERTDAAGKTEKRQD